MKNKKFPSIPINIIVYMAAKNLASKKLRSSLTIIGITIGIGSIFFLLSLGLGLQRLVTNEIIGNDSIKSIDISSSNSKIVKLNQEAFDKINNLGHIEKAGRSYSSAGIINMDSSEIDSVVYKTDKNFQEMSNLSILAGKLIDDNNTASVVINKSGIESLGIKNSKDALGKKLKLKLPINQSTDSTETDVNANEIAEEYTIIGVIDSGAGSELFINKHIFDQANTEQYSLVKVMADKTTNISGIRKQIESMGLETSSPIDTIDQINQIFKYFNIILLGFGTIGMIVAILGMFNTVTISLLERTKEIGLMVAIGGRRKDMRRLFIVESVLLSLVGSITGIVLASFLGIIINLFMNQMAHGRGVESSFNLFSTPVWLVFSLTLFMVIVGLIVVLIPSRRAEKINPIDALRRE